MAILFFLILLLLLAICSYVIFKALKWILKRNIRIVYTLIGIGFLLLLGVVNHLFFKNMQFIQSEVYPNLYIVKYPDNDQKVLQQAIKNQVLNHFKTTVRKGKPLSYSNKNDIHFYKYSGTTFGFLGEAGTGYFIDHEEDLGGFVTEELVMYSNYKLAQFYFNPCSQDSTLICGEIKYFKEGEIFKSEILQDK
ncbi:MULTISPECIES: hypothetical protein [Mesoflavibacter]|uniref:hypothetical protein n=1 Tax=Mesoflavibacter TaxID=444051 RepID=UPI000D10AF6F|nr:MULTISPECIES: hypothetical protein [Mesoflavibacter]QIJ90048.1 hypothetical protein C7H62_2240 [Mesoflavibacter sp. HG96]QIJ92776.1 hypothetical protein C7H56_2240 [Mesoflavibacter sp. HG37]